jgi:hypothetical protein
MEHIASSELPETLQQIFAEIQRTKTPLTITHEGEPLVIIYPATPQPQRPGFGPMKGSGEILGDVIAPVIPATTWQALQ